MMGEGMLGKLIQGILLGFSIAAPVGPIGVLCIRRALQNGFKSGLASGMGAASADAVYGTIAAAGLTLAAEFLAKQQTWLSLLGGAFLLYLGIQTFRSPPPEMGGADRMANSLAGDYFSTFLLTLSNPITIFSFMALFGGMGAGADMAWSAFVLVLGVFSGSALWWLALSGGVSIFRERFGTGVMHWVNRIAGVVILGFAVLMLGRVVATFF
jgi:threonine/homoserine/homoserine lactone efflux protein